MAAGSKFELQDDLKYLEGFNSYHQSEVAEGAIPKVRNLPQKHPYSLYPERISGTSFTVPRKDSKQTWLYRALPSTAHDEFQELPEHPLNAALQAGTKLNYKPDTSRWATVQIEKGRDILSGLRQIGGAGEPIMKNGLAYYVYTAEKSMPDNRAFYSADGDFLFAPQKGSLDIRTEVGKLRVRPHEIVVIPRGFKFHVSLPAGAARGFALEVFSGHFDLPELGPIGSVGLANARDFEIPVASYDSSDAKTEIIAKFAGTIHRADYQGSIFNVAGWHGTYYPFKYDLGKFNTIGSILLDHPDPSIFTVLCVPSEVPGESIVDVVTFGRRWLVMEDSYRPPYYHRNTMSEFAFIVEGGFDVEAVPPFLNGLFVLTNSMTGHGADPDSWKHAVTDELKPTRVPDSNLGIMFESRYIIGTTNWAENEAVKLPSRGSTFEKAKI